MLWKGLLSGLQVCDIIVSWCKGKSKLATGRWGDVVKSSAISAHIQVSIGSKSPISSLASGSPLATRRSWAWTSLTCHTSSAATSSSQSRWLSPTTSSANRLSRSYWARPSRTKRKSRWFYSCWRISSTRQSTCFTLQTTTQKKAGSMTIKSRPSWRNSTTSSERRSLPSGTWPWSTLKSPRHHTTSRSCTLTTQIVSKSWSVSARTCSRCHRSNPFTRRAGFLAHSFRVTPSCNSDEWSIGYRFLDLIPY